MTKKRRKAIIRRRIFLALIALLLAAIAAIVVFVVSIVKGNKNDNNSVSSDVNQISSEQSSSIDESEPKESSLPSTVTTPTGVTLDANFSRLLLTNSSNPLPDDYDTNVREYLVEIDGEYRNNNYVTQIHRDVYPYITAMVAAAQADGVDLRVWSPFRSYAIQNDLFRRQVARVDGNEELAATVVARPGTSEHNTGLCADFNMADDAFEGTPMYAWMCEHAEDYGFILRYPKDKQNVTGVIYESWHWRFVGINNAKEINNLGVTLEEYIEIKGINPTADMYGDDSQSSTVEQITD